MKTKLFILLIIVSGVILGCDNDDDSPQQNPTIAGTWHLMNISGGFAGIDADFERGKIKWIFEEETSTLNVINNHTDDETIYDGLESGMYPYATEDSNDVKILLIDGIEFGNYTLTENQLTIDQDIGSDGYFFTLER